MLKLVILLSAFACVLGGTIPEGLLPQLDGRIVGGSATTISKFPWQISLQRNGRHFCGGSIYSANIIVTAAHCLASANASSLMVRAGSSYWNSAGQLYSVAKFEIHAGYNSKTMVYDIALIKLSTSQVFGSTIKAIELAIDAPPNYAAAVVSGWGTTTFGSTSIPEQLRYTNVEIIRKALCASSNYGYGTAIMETMICAAATGKDSCQGDSGGPLVSGGRLVGVVSWGYGCAEPKYPGVYANVAALRGWVEHYALKISY